MKRILKIGLRRAFLYIGACVPIALGSAIMYDSYKTVGWMGPAGLLAVSGLIVGFIWALTSDELDF